MTDAQKIQKRIRIGNALIRFAGIVLLFSSLVKAAHPAKPVAYMNFLGYDDAKMFIIAAIEMVIGILSSAACDTGGWPAFGFVVSRRSDRSTSGFTSVEQQRSHRHLQFPSPLPWNSACNCGAGKHVNRRISSPPRGALECE